MAPLRPEDPRQLGPYRIAGRLGQGGMGAVFLASRQDGQWVAIKVIRPELAEHPEFRARFRREADSARKVKRFATAAVLDADPDGPQPYLVTEFVEGPTLSKLVNARGPLRPADLEHLALSVATALSAIHSAGIIHRDLTPSNVLLSPVGPKVIDFGLARSSNVLTNISHVGAQPIGTPGYMAPEQILDEPVTPAVDVFAWGSIVIYAGTGRSAWGDGPTEAVLYRIIHDEPRLDGIPDDLRELVAQAMCKDPAQRPSADSLRAVLMGSADATNPATATPARSTGSKSSRSPKRSASSKGPAGTGRSPRRPLLTRTPPADDGSGDNGGTIGLAPSDPRVSPPVSPYPLVSPAPSVSPPSSTARWPAPGPAVRPRTRQPDTPSPARAAGRHRRRLVLLGGLVAAVATASVLALTVLPGRDGASDANRAAVSRQVAARADANRPGDPTLAGRLAVAAFRISPTPEARRAMLSSFVTSSVVLLPQRGAKVLDAAWDARGRTLAEVDADGRLRLWDLTDRRKPTLSSEISPAATGQATGVTLGADGRLFAVGAADTSARMWEVAAPGGAGQLSQLNGHISPVVRLALDESGKLLVTAGADGTVGLWDVGDPHRPALLTFLPNRGGLVADLALRPDGRLLATAALNETVRLWDLTDRRQPRQVATMTGHVGAVVTVAFSQDGRLAVTGGDDHTLRLWDLSDPARPLAAGVLTAHDDRVTGAGFGADGLLVSADAGGTVMVWDAGAPLTAQPIQPIQLIRFPAANPTSANPTSAGNAVSRLVVSGEGHAFAVGGEDGGLRVLSTDPGTLAGIACADPRFRLSPQEWSRWVPRLSYSDPCPG